MPTPSQLLEFARQREVEYCAFLQDLVRIPSVNGRESEAALAERIQQEAVRLGLSCELVASDPARPNALVEWGEGPSSFALIGHMDTVAEGDPEQWSHPPFAAQIDNGRLYGRGAADNKAGIACGLYALALLHDQALLDSSAVRLILAGVVDEESGASSPLGVRCLLDSGRLPVQAAIYTYASDIICIGHRGLLRLVLEARGQSIHTGSLAWSRKAGGVNAVTGLAAILLHLEQLEIDAPVHPAFPGLNCTVTPGTLFQGGEFESIVPASATATVDVRLMPRQDSGEVIQIVQAIIDAETAVRPGLQVSMTVKNDLPGAAIPSDHRLAQIARAYTEAITGIPWPIMGAGPANEGYMLIGAGIPTLCGFGPTGGNAHAPDEWVQIDSLAPTIAMYAGIIHDYLLESTA